LIAIVLLMSTQLQRCGLVTNATSQPPFHSWSLT